MQCPACGYQEMQEQTYDEIVSHGGESIELTDMSGEVCPKCGEVVWDDTSYDRYFRAQDALVIKAGDKINKEESECVSSQWS